MVNDWLTVAQFLAKYEGKVGRTMLYEKIKDRTVPSVRLGRKILIPSDALDRLLVAAGAGTSAGK
jgi:excisionase family DNA binding protein